MRAGFEVTGGSGDALDGVYQPTVTLRASSSPGTYTVWMSAYDVLDNRTFTPLATFVVG